MDLECSPDVLLQKAHHHAGYFAWGCFRYFGLGDTVRQRALPDQCRWTGKPAVFPCLSRESGYIPRHLTRKHGSQRPSGGNRAI